MEGLAGDVAAGLRGQKDHGPGKILRYLDPPEGDVLLELKKKCSMVGVHRGVDGARTSVAFSATVFLVAP